MSRRSRRNKHRQLKQQRTQSNTPSHVANSTTTTVEEFSGPIPPPIILKQYDEIEPGMAKRVLGMAEKQVDHRIQLENKALNFANRQVTRSQWFAFIIAIVLVIAGTNVAIFSDPQWGVTLGGSGIVSILLSVLFRRKTEDNNTKQTSQIASNSPSPHI